MTLEVECLDRLYLNGYIGPLATPGGALDRVDAQLDTLIYEAFPQAKAS